MSSYEARARLERLIAQRANPTGINQYTKGRDAGGADSSGGVASKAKALAVVLGDGKFTSMRRDAVQSASSPVLSRAYANSKGDPKMNGARKIIINEMGSRGVKPAAFHTAGDLQQWSRANKNASPRG